MFPEAWELSDSAARTHAVFFFFAIFFLLLPFFSAISKAALRFSFFFFCSTSSCISLIFFLLLLACAKPAWATTILLPSRVPVCAAFRSVSYPFLFLLRTRYRVSWQHCCMQTPQKSPLLSLYPLAYFFFFALLWFRHTLAGKKLASFALSVASSSLCVCKIDDRPQLCSKLNISRWRNTNSFSSLLFYFSQRRKYPFFFRPLACSVSLVFTCIFNLLNFCSEWLQYVWLVSQSAAVTPNVSTKKTLFFHVKLVPGVHMWVVCVCVTCLFKWFFFPFSCFQYSLINWST